MAAENLKSTQLSNRDAIPVVFNSSNQGVMRRSVAVVEAAGGDAGSTYRFCAIPSNAKNIRVMFSCDDLGTGTTLDVGLYQTPANGGAVFDADFFASAIDVATGAVAVTDITYERAATRIADAEKPLWQQMGLSADPGRDYDITAVSGAAAATGTIMILVDYVV